MPAAKPTTRRIKEPPRDPYALARFFTHIAALVEMRNRIRAEKERAA